MKDLYLSIQKTYRLLSTAVGPSMSIALFLVATEPIGSCQTFNSGSDGSYGALIVVANTNLVVPPNGIFNCTTISVAYQTTVTFTKNALNTPIYMLATSNVDIHGTIDVSGGGPGGPGAPGGGGPGGFDGGAAGYSATGALADGADGHGPGASSVYYDAVFAQPAGGNSNIYGNVLLSPLIGGSGGHGGNNSGGQQYGVGGGGGGGAILIASSTWVHFQQGGVRAVGGNGGYNGNSGASGGGGSGGAIRIVAPLVDGYLSSLNVNGGSALNNPPAPNPGRIRVDCIDNYGYHTLTYYGVFTRGSQMFVFPPIIPTLSIIQAAGQTIPEGTGTQVSIVLQAGASTNQTVTVLARNFSSVIPVAVVVTPDAAPSSAYTNLIDMTATNVAQSTFNVVIPAGMASTINAWTR